MIQVEDGFLSSYGVKLDRTCVKCGVCVGVDEKNRLMEFDGMPHACRGTPFRGHGYPGQGGLLPA